MKRKHTSREGLSRLQPAHIYRKGKFVEVVDSD